MTEITLSRKEARRLILIHQGLWPPRVLEGKAGALDYVRRVGCIQFDPLNIVGQNPELVLQSRVADFDTEMLRELLYEDRKLLDAWDKNMSIYAVEDWPYFRRRRDSARRHYGVPTRPAVPVLPRVRQEIQTRGPLSSIDLDLNETVAWSWAPTRLGRAALESMYFWGELIVHHKVHTRKVYDFAARHLPDALLSAPDPNETEDAFHDWYVLRRVGGVGLMWDRAGTAWLGMSGIKSRELKAAIARLLEKGEIARVHVEGINVPLYGPRQVVAEAQASPRADLPPCAAILAPLDNMLWDRRFVRALFDFEYIWEVYKPVAERRYGYYVLPILYGDRFVARFEPGRDKESGALIVKNWWWEEGVTPSPEMQTALMACFRRFREYLGTNQLAIDEQALELGGLEWLRLST